MTEESPPKKGIQAEMLVAVSAVFIGVCALVVSLYETQLMREEQRASVLPIVELGPSYFTEGNDNAEGKWRLSLRAENVGIGPALIADFRVMVDGKPQATWRTTMNALLSTDTHVTYSRSTINGRTIPAERIVTMFDLSNAEIAPDIISEFDRLNFVACYCSVFKECWESSYDERFASATPVAECKRDADSFQQ